MLCCVLLSSVSGCRPIRFIPEPHVSTHTTFFRERLLSLANTERDNGTEFFASRVMTSRLWTCAPKYIGEVYNSVYNSCRPLCMDGSVEMEIGIMSSLQNMLT